MGPDDLLPAGHRGPHLPGGGDDDGIGHAPAESGPSAALAGDDDTLMTYADDERDEDEDEDIEDEEDNDYEDEEEDDDDEEEEDHAAEFCHHHHHHHHHHHQPHQPNTHPFAHQQYLYPPNTYPTDDLDMSDDGGAPLVNYLDVVSLLTNDTDMSVGFTSDGGYGFFGGGGGGHTQPEIENQQHTQVPNDAGPPPNESPPAEHAYTFSTAMPQLPSLQIAAGNSAALLQQLQQLEQFVDDVEGDGFTWFQGHPLALSNPNPNTLGPGNYGLVDFLKHWAGHAPGVESLSRVLSRDRGRLPWMSKINEQAQTHLTHVQYADLEGDQCDFQGIDWEDLGVTRREARERRLLTYTNYVNKAGSDRWSPHLPDMMLQPTDSFFRFRRMDIRRDVHLSHFQLRNVLASTSRTNAFYTGNGVVHSFNPVSGEADTVMKLGDMPASQVSTLAADHGVLIAGGFSGEYILRHLDSGVDEGADDDDDNSACHEGTITNHVSGITNHVQIHQSRQSSSPRAAFASNDMCFRILDINTETFVSRENFAYPLNCTALSPDRRLRVMVGDHQNVLITAAESRYAGAGRPEIIQELGGHRDHGFACDWADDGWTVATGFQDRSVKIWDARRWTDSSGAATPICTLRTEMAGVRGLRFSPVGSGKRVLVAAEEADYVNIIDAQTFASKQTFDVFGEIGGVAFSNGGQDLVALCCDRVRGGLVQLERCGPGAEAAWDYAEAVPPRSLLGRRRSGTYDWPRSRFTEEKRVRESVTKRRRKGASLDAMEPF